MLHSNKKTTGENESNEINRIFLIEAGEKLRTVCCLKKTQNTF
jgi:hypothetical protein